jgi:hypothetical protein
MSAVLPSWNEGQTKDSIVLYVQSAIDPKSDTFVPVEDRIVTFDNHGCCWNEKPAYMQLFFSLARLKQMATTNQACGRNHISELPTKMTWHTSPNSIRTPTVISVLLCK